MEVIRVEKLSKLYRLGEVGTGSLSHDLNRWCAKLLGKEDPFAKVGVVNDRTSKDTKNDYVWAIKDINFSVKQGEVLGVIGRNGAGKSTLLKIISQITSPTNGNIKIKGRIASLLEVGTGFHNEMTGRENIFLNGTLLGMTKREIQSKLDEIVDFAGVALYLDTPVKRYSSGMLVRLGFAVAAFLEPEILIVDEVLAVGDAEFQKKALGRMQDVSKNDGRTVLFVSHNMGAIRQLCQKAALLGNGSLEYLGDVSEAITKYLKSSQSQFFDNERNPKDPNYFRKIYLTNAKGDCSNNFSFDEDSVVVSEIQLEEWNPNLELSLSVYDSLLNRIFTKNIRLLEFYKNKSCLKLAVSFPGNFLLPGNYSWLMSINHPRVRVYDLQDNVLPFTIHETGSEFFNRGRGGVVFPPKTVIKHFSNGQ
jgi:lipopolysaccharide transport system ATP-binding protein